MKAVCSARVAVRQCRRSISSAEIAGFRWPPQPPAAAAARRLISRMILAHTTRRIRRMKNVWLRLQSRKNSSNSPSMTYGACVLMTHMRPWKSFPQLIKPGRQASQLPGMHVMRCMASGREALRQYRKNGKVLTQEIEHLCECSLSELRQFRDTPEKPSIPGDWAVALQDFERLHIDEIAVLLEKNSPGRVHDLLGYTKVRYLTLSYQLFAYSAPWVIEGENDEILRAIGDIHLRAPFSIRSAGLDLHAWKELKLREVQFRVYDKPLQADGRPPSGLVAKYQDFSVRKDMRMRFWGNKPVDPDAYGHWVLTA